MRYQDTHNGFINWPKDWEDTGEGGLIVHLYVMDKPDYADRWEECIDDCEFWTRMDFDEKAKGWYQGNDEMSKFVKSDLGMPILLAMKFGSTGKSYWNGNTMFAPGYSDLNDEGKQFIELLRKLYPGRRILMQTTLDT